MQDLRPDLPPTFSGYPTADRTGWDDFRAEYERTHRELWSGFDAWVREQGAPPLPDLEFIHTSRFLNLWVYPGAIDYERSVPLAPTWQRLESSVRDTEEPWQLPEDLRDGDGALVYLSLGSLGSADVELMRRLVDILSRTRHRYVVSKGPRADELELEAEEDPHLNAIARTGSGALVIAGDGPLRRQLEQRAMERGVADLVCFGVGDLDVGSGHSQSCFVGHVANQRTVKSLCCGWKRKRECQQKE